jgi:hypothetical protein
VDRGALLKLLSTLIIVSKKTREVAAYTVQLAALRLASHDVQLMKNNLFPVEAMSYALNDSTSTWTSSARIGMWTPQSRNTYAEARCTSLA